MVFSCVRMTYIVELKTVKSKKIKNIDCQNCIYLKDFIKEYYTVKLNFIFAINVLKC